MKQPAVRSLLGHELSPNRTTLPPLVSIGGNSFLAARPIGPAFLGARYQPLDVSVNQPGVAPGTADQADIRVGQPASLAVNSLSRFEAIDDARWARRLQLWDTMEGQFLQNRSSDGLRSHQATYRNARELMTSGQADVFDLSNEDSAVRQNYGVGTFGQGCLMARRLVEAGVSCVEVTLSTSTIGNHSWDSHSQNFVAVESLSRELDAGFAALLDDLENRGLLETTTVVCMGEFGRTPTINNNAGRDHFPRAFAGVMAGGRSAMGQTYGKTSADGMQIEDNPVTIPEWLATICEATGVDPSDTVQNESGRPVPIVDALPVDELIA